MEALFWRLPSLTHLSMLGLAAVIFNVWEGFCTLQWLAGCLTVKSCCKDQKDLILPLSVLGTIFVWHCSFVL